MEYKIKSFNKICINKKYFKLPTDVKQLKFSQPASKCMISNGNNNIIVINK